MVRHPAVEIAPKVEPKVEIVSKVKIESKPAVEPKRVKWTLVTTKTAARRPLRPTPRPIVVAPKPMSKLFQPSKPKPKPRKKKKKKKKAVTNVNDMDMEEFGDILSDFTTPVTNLKDTCEQDETRIEKARVWHAMRIKKRAFAAFKHQHALISELDSPMFDMGRPLAFVPMKAIDVMTRLLKYSYDRLQSPTFQKIKTTCRRQQLKRIVQRRNASQRKLSKERVIVEDEIPIASPDTQNSTNKLSIVPLRLTEWYNPVTYMWMYFSNVLPTKMRSEHMGYNLGSHWIFTREECARAAEWIERLYIIGAQPESPTLIQIDVKYRDINHSYCSKKTAMWIPSVLLTLLLETGYTMAQVAGFMTLHLWKLYHVISTSKALATTKEFKVYDHVPINVEWAQAMTMILMMPPAILADKIVPPDGTQCTDKVYVMPKSQLWAATHFVGRKLQRLIEHTSMIRGDLHTHAYCVAQRYPTLTVSSVLYMYEYWGHGMIKYTARAARHVDLLASHAARLMVCLGCRGKGMGEMTPENQVVFTRLATKLVRRIVELELARRSCAPLTIEGEKDTDPTIPVLDMAAVHTRIQRHVFGSVLRLQQYIETGISTHSVNFVTQCQQALLDLVRDGGSDVLELFDFWFRVVPDGDAARFMFDEFVWLVRYYDARSNDDNQIVVQRYYVDSLDLEIPATLEQSAHQNYRKQRAFHHMCDHMLRVRNAFVELTPAEVKTKVHTKIGLAYSVQHMRREMEVTMEYALRDAKASSTSTQSQSGDRLALGARVMPSHLLIVMYVQRCLLGLDMSTVDEFYFLVVYEEMMMASTGTQLWEARDALFRFFTRVILFAQGLHEQSMDLHRSETPELLNQLVSLGNFWIGVFHKVADPPDTTKPDFAPFQANWVYLKNELETMNSMGGAD